MASRKLLGIVAAVWLAFLLAAIVLPQFLSIHTVLYIEVTSIVVLLVSVGSWLILAGRYPSWLRGRAGSKPTAGTRLNGVVFVLIAVPLALADANSLFEWHAMWPVYVSTVVLIIGFGVIGLWFSIGTGSTGSARSKPNTLE